ncbi:MAG: hypothetical protein KJ767_00810 [Nanoarchaeota archaeon]|nr:hypothetical protein [Nanoarchaeota archaeon]
MAEDIFFKSESMKEVEGLAKILQNTLPKMGYKPVPSPGVMALHDGIDNRTYYFECGNSGCYYKFRLDNSTYDASIKFKNFPEKHYNLVANTLSRKYPQFFLEYAEK